MSGTGAGDVWSVTGITVTGLPPALPLVWRASVSLELSELLRSSAVVVVVAVVVVGIVGVDVVVIVGTATVDVMVSVRTVGGPVPAVIGMLGGGEGWWQP